jgi:glycosyltransferase involved in cell wall biosynthesis
VIPLIVDLETAWRGGQNQAFLLLKGLHARGHRAELVAAEGSALGERAAAIGVPVHFTPREGLRIPAARLTRKLVSGKFFSVVHANEAHAVTAVWLARVRRRVPLVISRRVGYPIGESWLARARYRAAQYVVANSEWVAQKTIASGVHPHNVEVVHEGVEIRPLLSAEQRQESRRRWNVPLDAPLLGCVGVLLPDKGQEWLIRTLAALRSEFPTVRLLLAGDGPCRPALEQLTRELGLSDAVIFAGFVNDVESVYAALDVFLLPSFFEALNNSLLLAMAYEIPSIAFHRGALGEIIVHEESGLLVSGPDVEEIRGAVARILRDTALARKLGQQGRKRVEENFSAARMVEGMLRVYEKVLREKESAP